MSSLGDLDRSLAAARPADPQGGDLDAATVRVLARVEMLEAGAPARAHRVCALITPAARVAAIFALVLLATQTAPSLVPPAATPASPAAGEVAVAPVADAPVTVAPPASAVTPPSWLHQALAGDPLARRTALRGGPSTRLALLDFAEQFPDRAGETLALLRAVGGIQEDAEAARLRRLAQRPSVRATAIDLLAAGPSNVGLRHLGRLLVDVEDAERLVVDALTRVAHRGRRSTALAALLDGAEAGRMLAASEAMRLVQGRSLETLLDVLPDAALLDARLAVAVRESPATVRDRLLRRAARGDVRALRLAIEARLAWVVGLLADRIHDEDAVVASAAVRDLVRQHRAEAWYHVARATGGPGADAARRALREAPRSTLVGLERTARENPSRRPAAVAGLASAGPKGLLALERLTERPALRAPVIAAIAQTEGDEAVDLLAELASMGRAPDLALLALGNRVSRGDEHAGRALLALARGSPSRQAARMLARYGEALGAGWLEHAAADTSLSPGARASLLRASRRVRGERGEGPTTRRGTAPSPVT